MEKGRIEDVRLVPQETYKTLYQADGMPPTHHNFTTRTLWNGSRTTFSHKPARGTSALLSDRFTKLEEGNFEATSATTERDICSIGPFEKSVTVLTGDNNDGFFFSGRLVDVQAK